MTESEMPADPRDVDDAELAAQEAPPLPGGDSGVPGNVVEDEHAQGDSGDTDAADRDVPADGDYAGSGF